MNHHLDPFRPLQSTKKDRIWNISQLLGKNVITPPQKVMTQRLRSQNGRKNSIIPDLTARKQLNSRNINKKNNQINFQHYRIKSSLKNYHSELSLKRTLTQNANTSSLKITQSLRNSFQSSQLPRSTSLRCAELHHKNLKNQQLLSKKLLSRKTQYDTQESQNHYFAKSLELKKKVELFPKPIDLDLQRFNHKNNFLKKGTSLQKQIVINLLKNKIIKQYQRDIEKQYTMKDIVSMIKVYKGIYKNQLQNPQQCFTLSRKSQNPSFGKISEQKQSMNCPLKVVKQFKKTIDGWDIEPDLEIEYLKRQQDNVHLLVQRDNF